MIKARITDGSGSGHAAHVLVDGEQLVSVNPSPPLIRQKVKIYGEFFTDTGMPDGSNYLGVDGSTTAVDFWIPSNNDTDKYITKLNFIVGYGSSSPLYDFVDSGGPLTNGVRIFYSDTFGNEDTIANITRNYSFLRFSLVDSIVPTSWELRSLGASQDYGYICSIDLQKIMPPFGVKLDKETKQRMTITIRDDCTDADLFNCRAFGFERFE